MGLLMSCCKPENDVATPDRVNTKKIHLFSMCVVILSLFSNLIYLNLGNHEANASTSN